MNHRLFISRALIAKSNAFPHRTTNFVCEGFLAYNPLSNTHPHINDLIVLRMAPLLCIKSTFRSIGLPGEIGSIGCCLRRRSISRKIEGISSRFM